MSHCVITALAPNGREMLRAEVVGEEAVVEAAADGMGKYAGAGVEIFVAQLKDGATSEPQSFCQWRKDNKKKLTSQKIRW